MGEPAPATITDLFFEQSEKIDLFAKAFPKAQAAMGDVLKKATNPAFRSKYADLSAVVEAVVPPLNETGFSVLQPVGCSDGRARIATMILHESGQWMRCTLTIQPTKSDPQGIGSAITYGRRYGLQAMTGVAPEDDDGNAASRPRDNGSQPRELVPTPHPEGPDFWGCDGPGMTAHAAKKEGLGDFHDKLRHEASELPNREALREFCETHRADIARMPQSWRVELRSAVDERASELGITASDRRAA